MKTRTQQKQVGEMSNSEFVAFIRKLRKDRGCLKSDAASIKKDYSLPSVAIGYGKYVVVIDDGLHTHQLCKRRELGKFDSLPEAEAFIASMGVL